MIFLLMKKFLHCGAPFFLKKREESFSVTTSYEGSKRRVKKYLPLVAMWGRFVSAIFYLRVFCYAVFIRFRVWFSLYAAPTLIEFFNSFCIPPSCLCACGALLRKKDR